MDFVKVKSERNRGKTIIFPEFKVGRNKDIMFRGGDFYAVYNEETGLWSKDITDCKELIDKELYSKVSSDFDGVEIRSPSDFTNNVWTTFTKYCKLSPQLYSQLDRRIIFADEETNRSSYASFKLPYVLSDSEPIAYNEIMETIYDEQNLQKLEWAIGAVYSGDSRKIQKAIALYGKPGSGKSTILHLIERLFSGYVETIDASAMGDSRNQFRLETIQNNPLVAIQNEADLSKLSTNVSLNSIISHDPVIINAKHKNVYTIKPESFIFIATNTPINITDSKSGLIRRIIDVQPSGKKIPENRFRSLENQMHKELGAIANKCIRVYNELGPDAYADYRPTKMMEMTDPMYQYFEDYSDIILAKKAVTFDWLKTSYSEYMTKAGYVYMPKDGILKESFKDYFEEYIPKTSINGESVRHLYRGLKLDKLKSSDEIKIAKKFFEVKLELKETKSKFDELYSDCQAQYAKKTDESSPADYWDNVKTCLKDIDTTKIHYVRPPENHIVIDFDLKNEKGEKSLEKNLIEAAKYPPTYAELSKSGCGVHLHYIYNGDVSRLANIIDKDIEIKTFKGKSALRRKLSLCNDLDVAVYSGSLPEKETKMLNDTNLKDEKHLRARIAKALRKEIHPNTKCNIDYIYAQLEEAYTSGMLYDVSDMKGDVRVFASRSSHQAPYCQKTVDKMHFKSEAEIESVEDVEDKKIMFFDCEVYPNLFVVCGMLDEEDEPSVKMVNPTSNDIQRLIDNYNLIGHNCKRYDNYIFYFRCYNNYNNEQLYDLSQKIIKDKATDLPRRAQTISYTDTLDFASAANKKTLKYWENALHISHMEMEIPWDQPVPEELIPNVVEYCGNDVKATKVLFHHLKEDWDARCMLAELSGLTVNDSTNSHTTRIIFGTERKPQSEFNYIDEAEEFPGYKFKDGQNLYRGINLGRGGYVYAKPGMYGNVALLDVKSMHPHSIMALNLFGKYTKNFADLVNARVGIKEKRYDDVRSMFDGKFAKYLTDDSLAKALSTALKTPINAVYGLTSASFDNPFKDQRNKNNIVALRGALFMKTLQDNVTEMGYEVVHIKTDSIKIADADDKIINYCMDFAKKYGYEFDYEDNYDKICLVNDAVYIAKSSRSGEWTATGAQFAEPYVFKSLFSHEPMDFYDYTIIKEVTTKLYLDLNEGLGEEHNYKFVGKTGSFLPVIPGIGGGKLLRQNKDEETYSFATGTKDYLWLESNVVKELGWEDKINMKYYNHLLDDAIDQIKKYGDYEWFISEYPYKGIKLYNEIVA